jgi:hypothetical protein
VERAAVGQLEIALGAFERLNGRLLIDREHDGVLGRREERPTMAAALAANSGSPDRHQDLRPARSIRWARKKRQMYWSLTSPSSWASSGAVHRAKPTGGGRSSSARMRRSASSIPARAKSTSATPQLRLLTPA